MSRSARTAARSHYSEPSGGRNVVWSSGDPPAVQEITGGRPVVSGLDAGRLNAGGCADDHAEPNHDADQPHAQGPLVDVRAPRFAAWVTTAVLTAVLLTGSTWLLAAQTVVFALGATGRQPYALVFKRLHRTPASEKEPAAPLRFAQLVGLAFAAVGTLALLAGATTAGLTAAALALAAAMLNAAFGICLGCELYLTVRRMTHRGQGATA